MQSNDKFIKSVLGGISVWFGLSRGTDAYLRCKVLRDAYAYAWTVGKPVLNISCGRTEYGHVNADITEQSVARFVKYNLGEKLPFADKQFGAVYTSHTLEHTDDPMAFYQELCRVAEKVFPIYPLVYESSAYWPFHKWIALDLSGQRWFKNPFYSEKIEAKVNDIDHWSSSGSCQWYFGKYIEPLLNNPQFQANQAPTTMFLLEN